MAYPVNEDHRELLAEAGRLFNSLSLPIPAAFLPAGDGYLFLVPALHAIVERLEKLEQQHEYPKPDRF